MAAHDWSDVTERLARLAANPAAAHVFGSGDYRWELEPPLTAGDLAEVESRLGVTLPGEYRSFLLQVGSGGGGPAYGLFPLQRIDGAWRWDGDGAGLTDLDTLAEPFPYTDACNPADALPVPPDPDHFDTTEAFNEAEDAYWTLHAAVVDAPQHTVGLLYLCHLGCALREALVVSGPARGQMWTDDTVEGGGFRPLLDDGNRVGFADWYRRWLNEAEYSCSPEAGAGG